MPINFPFPPSLNQQYTYSGRTWQWNGSYWDFLTASPGVSGLFTASGISGNTTIGNVTIGLSGGTISSPINFTGGVTANTISATTLYSTNISQTVYVLPSSVACAASATTTAATINIPRISVYTGQTIKVEGMFVGQQPTVANKTVTCFWNNGPNGQANVILTTSNTGSFGFLARITQAGVFFTRQAIYISSNQSSATVNDVSGNINIRVEVNPSSSAATLEHLVVTIY